MIQKYADKLFLTLSYRNFHNEGKWRLDVNYLNKVDEIPEKIYCQQLLFSSEFYNTFSISVNLIYFSSHHFKIYLKL